MDICLFTLENLDCSKTDFLTEFNTGGDYRHALNTEMRLQYGGNLIPTSPISCLLFLWWGWVGDPSQPIKSYCVCDIFDMEANHRLSGIIPLCWIILHHVGTSDF